MKKPLVYCPQQNHVGKAIQKVDFAKDYCKNGRREIKYNISSVVLARKKA